ncbi:MAG: CHAT domain-containing protein [Spirulina sp.]
MKSSRTPLRFTIVAFLLSLSLTLSSNAPSAARVSRIVERDAAALAAIDRREANWEKEYETFFNRDFASLGLSAEEISPKLAAIEQQTGQTAAVLWILAQSDKLNLIVSTKDTLVHSVTLLDVSAENLHPQLRRLQRAMTAPRGDRHLSPASKLYDWLIRPVQDVLKAEGIETLLICPGAMLRSLPWAALYDAEAEQFLIEQYSFSVIPAFNLINIAYRNLQDAQVLAMGASQFTDRPALPGVEAELQFIPLDRWQDKAFLNEEFTTENLKQAQADCGCEIVHLATHADFQPGEPRDSFIQFYDRPLPLDEVTDFNWHDPLVELLVLSACETAIGDRSAELGFAGLAMQSGVKSALASLWYVSDTGTMGLMSEFYRNLAQAPIELIKPIKAQVPIKPIKPIKAEALRQAQLAMLKGQVFVAEGQLQTSTETLELPADLNIPPADLTHPYYWAAYNLIGSPW